MGTVNNNYAVLQYGSFHTGDFWGERLYDWYEWRDYQKDNIGGDRLSRYQLWEKSDPGDWMRNGEYERRDMETDLEKLRIKYKDDEERREAAERAERQAGYAATAASRAAWGGNGRNGRGADMGGFSHMSTDVDMSVLLGRLNQLGAVNPESNKKLLLRLK
jgi:hypothetical protein